MNRRTFIALFAVGGGNAVFGFPRLAAQTIIAPQIGASIKTYGAFGDGRTDDSRALVAACRDLNRGVVNLPAGNYLIGNPVTIRDFSGTLVFEEGAKLQFAYKDRPGLRFSGGIRAKLINYQASWRDVPTRRLLARGSVEFTDSIEPYLENPIIENSNAAGIIFYGCIRPRISGAQVNNTMSDGIHFANCEAPHVEDSIIRNTGDDGLAFVNYANASNKTGGYARGIVVQTSKARGISVVGQSNVEVFDFSVSDTASSGICCITDSSYDTRSPTNVLFVGGRIEGSGGVKPTVGNQYGVEIEQTGAVTLRNIDILNSKGRGLSVNSPRGSITISDVKVLGVRENSGAEIRAKEVSVDGLKVMDAPRYGVYVAATPKVSLAGVTVINSASSFDLRRAIWFDGNGQISAGRLVVVDTRTFSLGNVVGAGPGQSGAVAELLYYVADGQGIRVENGSSAALAFPKPLPILLDDL